VHPGRLRHVQPLNQSPGGESFSRRVRSNGNCTLTSGRRSPSVAITGGRIRSEACSVTPTVSCGAWAANRVGARVVRLEDSAAIERIGGRGQDPRRDGHLRRPGRDYRLRSPVPTAPRHAARVRGAGSGQRPEPGPLDLLSELTRSFGISLLFITHDLAIAAERADSLVVLKDGVVQEHRSSKNVFSAPKSERPSRREIA
jgi:hypothetical protein